MRFTRKSPLYTRGANSGRIGLRRMKYLPTSNHLTSSGAPAASHWLCRWLRSRLQPPSRRRPVAATSASCRSFMSWPVGTSSAVRRRGPGTADLLPARWARERSGAGHPDARRPGVGSECGGGSVQRAAPAVPAGSAELPALSVALSAPDLPTPAGSRRGAHPDGAQASRSTRESAKNVPGSPYCAPLLRKGA